MPLMRIEKVGNETQLALWHMTESDQELLQRYPYMADVVSSVGSTTRRQERLCACALLEALTGDRHPMIKHDANGKPCVENASLSISHTRNYCVMLYSRLANLRLGVDIEWMSDRVERITSYFMRSDEIAPALTDKLLAWSAKETCYKYYSEQDLKYSEMKVEKSSEDLIMATNFRNGEKLPIKFLVDEKFVLTWSNMCNYSY